MPKITGATIYAYAPDFAIYEILHQLEYDLDIHVLSAKKYNKDTYLTYLRSDLFPKDFEGQEAIFFLDDKFEICIEVGGASPSDFKKFVKKKHRHK